MRARWPKLFEEQLRNLRANLPERFRNTEIVTVRDGQIVEVEVYFGWSIPHKAELGGFVEDDED
jgi:hypothetical protein